MNKKSKWAKAVVAVACALVVLFLGAELANISSDSFTTQTALEQTVLETLDMNMFILRDESMLLGSSSYTIVPLIDNAERISKGGTVAAYFASDAAASNFVAADQLEEKLKSYETIDKQLSLANVDMQKLTESVDAAFDSVIGSAYEDDYSSFAYDKLDFLKKLSLKQISLGESIDCSAEIEAISAQISSLRASAQPVSTVTADRAGYYVSKLDGYENAMDFSQLGSFTVADVEKAIASEKQGAPAGCLGKVIAGYDWYILGVAESNRASAFTPGKRTKIITGTTAEEYITAEVYSVSASENGKSVITFKCNQMNAELSTMRIVAAKVVISEVTGLKVSREAVRVNESGENGVYIKRGNIVSYRSLNVVHSEESMVIAKAPEQGSDIELSAAHLKQYDEIIISGKDLHDGMVIG